MHRFTRHLIFVFLAVVGPTAFASESDTEPASYENNYRFSLSYSDSGDGNTAIEFVVRQRALTSRHSTHSSISPEQY
jgi:hypothetical protein